MLKLKLYVWTDFNSDYTNGLAFAIAKTTTQARAIVKKANGGREPYQWGDLTIHLLTEKVGYCVSGGG
jgi:hypothetical protein